MKNKKREEINSKLFPIKMFSDNKNHWLLEETERSSTVFELLAKLLINLHMSVFLPLELLISTSLLQMNTNLS